MFRELFRELFIGPDSSVTAQYFGTRINTFFLDKLFATICIGTSWTLFLKLWRTKRKFLGSEDPRYLYMRNRRLHMTDTLHARKIDMFALSQLPQYKLNEIFRNAKYYYS